MTIHKPSLLWRPARILAATDLSPIADAALRYATGLARHFGAHLYLTHVLTGTDRFASVEERLAANHTREYAEREMSAILNSEEMAGIRATVLLEEGFVLETLETLILKHQIDLVIVGTHGRKDARKEFLGSWAELTFRHAECPVMIVGPAAAHCDSREVKLAKIVFATDFGRAASHAVPYACSLAREYKAALVLLHVTENTANYSETESAMLRETARVRLLETLPPGVDQECTFELLVLNGDPAQEILRVARSKKAGVIVMGASAGRNVVTHLPEPIAYTVAAGAPCPVLTVRTH